MKPAAALILGLLHCPLLCAQMLAIDRGIPDLSGSGSPAIRIGWTKSPGFVGDHFILGRRGEVWIIDSIRTYALPETNAPIEDLYEKTMLFGGIEALPPEPGQPPQPVCDCHNLMVIQSNALAKGTAGNAAAAQRMGPELWQVDFQNMHWSVPGGVPIQFGVTAKARRPAAQSHAWFNRASLTGETRALRVFDDKGKPGELLAAIDGTDPEIGLDVKVWAHKMTPVSIKPAGAMIEVTVPGSAVFDPRQIDLSSLRFGPAGTVAESSRIAVAGEKTQLVVSFRRAATGLRGNLWNVCLNGKELDGPPFEGCDQLQLQP